VTATDVAVTHDWLVVAPWWHWPRLDGDPAPGDPAKRRAVRIQPPALQKYDSPDLINTFLADPQRRLAFSDDSDRVATIVDNGPAHLPGRTTAGGPRKLYLATHHRHYLVVCALHCDAPGLPRARGDDVCEAGFVVRRRAGTLPGGPAGEAAIRLRHWARARSRLQQVDRRLKAEPGAVRREFLERRRTVLATAESAAREQVRAVARDALAGGSTRELQGWVPLGLDTAGVPGPMPACGGGGRTPLTGAGAWLPVEELPEQLTEATYPLAPQPGDDPQTIYFGVVPVGSADLDRDGRARYDDDSVYEIRCYARRHRPECPRDGGHCGCPLFWSEPTDAYRLAGHFDLEGCANRPVTVQMPDIAQLRADALRLGPGGAGGLRFRTPAKSELSFVTDDLKASASAPMQNTAVQICTFAVPLITIVATFLLQLFMPIVVFVFQLWFLLALRFCIPPDVTVGSGLAAEFEALGKGLDIDAGLAVNLAARPTFVNTLADLLNRSKPQGVPLGDKLAEEVRDGRVDASSYVAVGRSALATAVVPSPAQIFAPRIERPQVVTP
jgi:hypothetical protein